MTSEDKTEYDSSLPENKRASIKTGNEINKFLKKAIEKGWIENSKNTVIHPDKDILLGLNLLRFDDLKDIPTPDEYTSLSVKERSEKKKDASASETSE